jgi:hypothetical protein
VLAAGAIAITRGGKEAIVAAGRGMRVIVPILHHRVRSPDAAMRVRACCGMIVAVLGRHLVVLIATIIRPILRP